MDFHVIKGPRFTPGSLDAVLATFREYLGKEMVIRVHFVDHIDMVRTGKHNAVVSKLKLDFQRGTYHPD
jgi:hypothetical protein